MSSSLATLLVVLSVLLGPVYLSIFYVAIYFAAKRREHAYKRLERRLANTDEAPQILRARYCSEARFRRFWKCFPWEAIGVLTVRGDQIAFVSEMTSGEQIGFVLPRGANTIEFVGTNFWRNGLASWIRIRGAGGEHFFTPETGVFVFGSESKCRELYDRLVGAG